MRETTKALDQLAEPLTELRRRSFAGQGHTFGDLDLIEQPRERGRRAASVLCERVGERVLNPKPGALERAEIDQISLLCTPDDGTQLVGEDLSRRVDPHACDVGLVLLDLPDTLEHRVHDDRLIVSSEHDASETRSVLANIEGGTEGFGDLGQYEAPALECLWLRGEEVEVEGLAMHEVIASQCGTPGQEEPLLASEKSGEDRLLQGSEPTG